MVVYKNLTLFTALAALAGCTGNRIASEVAAKNNENIKRVVNLYSAYQSVHGWQGPKDEKALKDFVTKHGIPEKNLQMMGIDSSNLDTVLKSDRDGKPFKIRYGVSGGIGVSNALVFEDHGVDGKRQVGFNGPFVEEVDDAKYQQLWAHGGKPMEMESHAGARPTAYGSAKSK